MDVGPMILMWALLYGQQVVARLLVRSGFDEVGYKSDEELSEG